MEEKDSGVVEVRVLCSSAEIKGGKDEMIFGAALGLMVMKIWKRSTSGCIYTLILKGFYLPRTLC